MTSVGVGDSKVISDNEESESCTDVPVDECNREEQASQDGDEIVSEVSDEDVLLGRGTGPNEQSGNIRFRALVRRVLQGADLANLDGKLKANLAREILNSVKSRNGRFLKPNPRGGNARGRSFVVVSDSVALDKIKQSFRHQLRVLGVTEGESAAGKAAAAAAESARQVSSGLANVAAMYSSIPFSALASSSSPREPSQDLSSLAGSNLNLLLRDQFLEKKLLDHAYASQVAATSRTLQEAAMLSTALNPAMVAVVNSLANAKAEATIRQASSTLSLPTSAGAGAVSPLLSNSFHLLENNNSLVSSGTLGLGGLGALESRLSLIRALSLASATTTAPPPTSILDVLLRDGM
jgi:hypothetical protein